MAMITVDSEDFKFRIEEKGKEGYRSGLIWGSGIGAILGTIITRLILWIGFS